MYCDLSLVGKTTPSTPSQSGSVPAALKAPLQAFFPLAALGALNPGLLPARNQSSALHPTLHNRNGGEMQFCTHL